MQHNLSAEEVRVLGCLLEKEVLTPDVYPMTLNGLVNACNQKSSRDPVVAYDEAAVQRAVDALRAKTLVRMATAADSRAAKYRQIVTETYALTPRETAALTVLLLRGPQTAGEIRARSGRLYEFAETHEVDETLAALAERQFVTRLARQPGARESRFMHLFSPFDEGKDAEAAPAPSAAEPRADRAAALEARVEALEAELAALRDELARFRNNFV